MPDQANVGGQYGAATHRGKTRSLPVQMGDVNPPPRDRPRVAKVVVVMTRQAPVEGRQAEADTC